MPSGRLLPSHERVTVITDLRPIGVLHLLCVLSVGRNWTAGTQSLGCDWMHLTLHGVKAVGATVVSLSMAALGCLVGCMQPAASSPGRGSEATAPWNMSADAGQPTPVADAETCHKSGGNPPASPTGRKPASNGPLTCCPLEVTVIQRWDATELSVVPPQDFAPSSHFLLVPARFFGPSEFAQPLSHSGRDTLLETQLLRI